MAFSVEELAACRRLVSLALEEDLGASGDLTSQAVIPLDLQASATFVARAPGVLAGIQALEEVARAVDTRLMVHAIKADGDRLVPGDRFATITGPMRGILAVERTALNFMQHLSGIASLTRRYVDAVAGLPCQILDTRKTISGWRLLAKYAVRQGGGHNHRMGLYDGILIKDNHLAALRQGLESVTAAITAALAKSRRKAWVEVEVESLDQLQRALGCHPDMILLDNMDPGTLREAVRLRDAAAAGVLLEASGGINLETVRAIAETGMDRISVGALTHSAPALDIALDYGS